jgi:hypothetical protein
MGFLAQLTGLWQGVVAREKSSEHAQEMHDPKERANYVRLVAALRLQKKYRCARA